MQMTAPARGARVRDSAHPPRKQGESQREQNPHDPLSPGGRHFGKSREVIHIGHDKWRQSNKWIASSTRYSVVPLTVLQIGLGFRITIAYEVRQSLLRSLNCTTLALFRSR